MKNTFKKVICFCLSFIIIFTLASCTFIDKGSELSFKVLPKPIYVMGESGSNAKDVKEKVEVLVDGKVYSLAKLESMGAIVEGLDFSKPGNKVLIVSFNNNTISFDFEVLSKTDDEALSNALVNSMNAYLTEAMVSAELPTLFDAFKVLEAYGYNETVFYNNKLCWNVETGLVERQKAENENENYFVVVANDAELTTVLSSGKYSIYLKESGLDFRHEIEYSKGFDAGKHTGVISFTYNDSSDDNKDVVIRMNNFGAELAVESLNDDIHFFGQVGKVCGNEDGAGASLSNASLYIDEDAEAIYAGMEKGNIENDGTIDLVYGKTNEVVVHNNGVIDHAHGFSKEVAEALNLVSTGVKFDYNNNVEQNNVAEVYHHVSEGTTVAGEKPVTGLVDWAEENIEETINLFVDQVSGYVLKVKFANKVEKMKFDEFRDRWNDGEFYNNFESATLTANIDISDVDWYPIGNWEYPFYGTFEGNGKTISGLTAKSIDKDHQGLYSTGDTIGFGETYGLFGIVGDDVVVKNLDLTNVDINIYNGKNVGSLIGYVPNNGDFVKADKGGDYWSATATAGKKVVTDNLGTGNVSISNVSVSGNILAASHIGGLVGKVYSSGDVTIDGCENGLTITETGLGGLAGFVGYCNGVNNIYISNCKNLEGSKLTFDPSSASSGVMLTDFAYSTVAANVYDGESNINNVTIVLPTTANKKTISQFTYSGEEHLTLENYDIVSCNCATNLTLKNCTIDKLDNYGNVTIEGGTYGAIDKPSLNNGTMLIKGGTFNHHLKLEKGSSTEIVDGEFKGDINQYGNLKISGGSFVRLVTYENSTTEIIGGSINKLLNYAAPITISGGTFKSNPFDYLADGYISRLQNGAYIVEKGEWSAEYNDKKYATLQEAVDAYNGSGSIKLLRDFTENVIATKYKGTQDNMITIDLNSHEFEGELTANCVAIIGNGTMTITGGKISDRMQFGWDGHTTTRQIVISGGEFNIIFGKVGSELIFNDDLNDDKEIKVNNAFYANCVTTINSGTFEKNVVNKNQMTITGGLFKSQPKKEGSGKAIVYEGTWAFDNGYYQRIDK